MKPLDVGYELNLTVFIERYQSSLTSRYSPCVPFVARRIHKIGINFSEPSSLCHLAAKASSLGNPYWPKAKALAMNWIAPPNFNLAACSICLKPARVHFGRLLFLTTDQVPNTSWHRRAPQTRPFHKGVPRFRNCLSPNTSVPNKTWLRGYRRLPPFLFLCKSCSSNSSPDMGANCHHQARRGDTQLLEDRFPSTAATIALPIFRLQMSQHHLSTSFWHPAALAPRSGHISTFRRKT